MVEVAERLHVGAEVEAGEVEEREQVPVAHVEEEVRRPLVVPVAEQLGERELQEALVELDRLLDIGADQRDVVDAAGRRGRAALGDVLSSEPGALSLDRVQVDVGHGGLPCNTLPFGLLLTYTQACYKIRSSTEMLPRVARE